MQSRCHVFSAQQLEELAAALAASSSLWVRSLTASAPSPSSRSTRPAPCPPGSSLLQPAASRPLHLVEGHRQGSAKFECGTSYPPRMALPVQPHLESSSLASRTRLGCTTTAATTTSRTGSIAGSPSWTNSSSCKGQAGSSRSSWGTSGHSGGVRRELQKCVLRGVVDAMVCKAPRLCPRALVLALQLCLDAAAWDALLEAHSGGDHHPRGLQAGGSVNRPGPGGPSAQPSSIRGAETGVASSSPGVDKGAASCSSGPEAAAPSSIRCGSTAGGNDPGLVQETGSSKGGGGRALGSRDTGGVRVQVGGAGRQVWEGPPGGKGLAGKVGRLLQALAWQVQGQGQHFQRHPPDSSMWDMGLQGTANLEPVPTPQRVQFSATAPTSQQTSPSNPMQGQQRLGEQQQVEGQEQQGLGPDELLVIAQALQLLVPPLPPSSPPARVPPSTAQAASGPSPAVNSQASLWLQEALPQPFWLPAMQPCPAELVDDRVRAHVSALLHSLLLPGTMRAAGHGPSSAVS